MIVKQRKLCCIVEFSSEATKFISLFQQTCLTLFDFLFFFLF